MKVFRPVAISDLAKQNSPEIREQAQKAKIKAAVKTKGRPPKPEMSPGEIREKIAELKASKGTPAAHPDLTAKRATYEKEGPKEVKPAEEVMGDVGLNDPKDPMTSEKLKGVLQSGAINFSAKEREVLAGILGD